MFFHTDVSLGGGDLPAARIADLRNGSGRGGYKLGREKT